MLVDGGPSGQVLSTQLGPKLPFWGRTIDLVVLTHPDDDHLAGLVEVLRRYRVRHVLASGQGSSSPSYEEWRRLIEEKDIRYDLARAGQSITLGAATLRVLHPPQRYLEGTASDDDNNSVVLRLEYGNFTLLLTGDLYYDGERYLLGEGRDVRAAVLKVAHHGSAFSSGEEFLAAVEPRVAVVSVGADSRYGHPSPEVMGRLRAIVGDDNIYLTSEQGTVELITDGERLWVRTER